MKRLSDQILRSGMKGGRLIAFVASAFTGLFIVMAAIMLLVDIRSIWAKEDSFLNTDYIVLNHKASIGSSPIPFTEEEIVDLEAQPWVRRVGPFSSADFRVAASINLGSGSFSSLLFFESVPDEFLDISPSVWKYTPGEGEVPVILSKSYLTLYNFGFAQSAGTPQITEELLSSIPLTLDMTSDNGDKQIRRPARVVALSNRLNTILVPESFLRETNTRLGGKSTAPGRLIVDVSRPGDTAIERYLSDHGLERATDGDNAAATFLLRVAASIAGGIGLLITLLSGIILSLSISLLLERNRDRIARLKMLGYTSGALSRPFRQMILRAIAGSWILAGVCEAILCAIYRGPLTELGGSTSGIFPALTAGLCVALIIYISGVLTIRRSV